MKIRYVLVMCGLLGLASCVKDDSTGATGAISEILIDEGSVKELYDIDKNEVLTITPQCKQTNGQKALSYTWEIDQKVYSHEPQFVYKGERLGTYLCRLIVENEDGKTFFPFKLNVNSPYEEGITVLSHDAQGKSMLSFMLKQRVPGVEDHFEDGDCFTVNNPDILFADSVTDMVQCDGNLIVSCKGNNHLQVPATIYYLNEKTFMVQNEIRVPEYANFNPIRLGIPADGYVGTAYPILSEDGKIYEFSISESALVPSTRLTSNYAPACGIYSTSSTNFTLLFWDNTRHAFCQLTNGYGPYYCSKTYNMKNDNFDASKNYFNGKDFVAMFMPRLLSDASTTEEPTVVVIVKNSSSAMYQKVELNATFWKYNADQGENVLVDNGGLKMCGFAAPKLKATSPLVASNLYKVLFFGDGNTVYKWFYTSNQMLDKSEEYCKVGSAQAIIGSMELSQDQKELFVAFHEPAESGLNGHVWVYDTQDGALLRKYDNVCYQPVKIMYKKK